MAVTAQDEKRNLALRHALLTAGTWNSVPSCPNLKVIPCKASVLNLKMLLLKVMSTRKSERFHLLRLDRGLLHGMYV